MKNNWYRDKSPIHGDGAFAASHFKDGDIVGPLTVRLSAGGMLGEIRTDLGKMINHQDKPNGRMINATSVPDKWFLKAMSDIEPGSELTMNYNDTPWFVAKPHQVDPGGYKDWK